MFLFQTTLPDPSITGNVFGISPSTVYGVLAGLLFLAVSILGRLYINSHDRLVLAKEDEIKKLQESVTNLVAENRELHNKLYEMGTGNIKTLEKFGTLLEAFLRENKETQKELMVSIRDLTNSINKSVELSKAALKT